MLHNVYVHWLQQQQAVADQQTAQLLNWQFLQGGQSFSRLKLNDASRNLKDLRNLFS